MKPRMLSTEEVSNLSVYTQSPNKIYEYRGVYIQKQDKNTPVVHSGNVSAGFISHQYWRMIGVEFKHPHLSTIQNQKSRIGSKSLCRTQNELIHEIDKILDTPPHIYRAINFS